MGFPFKKQQSAFYWRLVIWEIMLDGFFGLQNKIGSSIQIQFVELANPHQNQFWQIPSVEIIELNQFYPRLINFPAT